MNRTWRYHKDCPEGRIFEHDDEPGEDWVDTPDKLIHEPAFDPNAIVFPSAEEETATLEKMVPRKKHKGK